MSRLLKWYGARPLHLLVMLATLAVAAYVAPLLLSTRAAGTSVWFVAAAVLHDLLLLPLYAIADRALVAVWRRSPGGATSAVPWLNHVRFPVAISLLLLLVFWPGISRRDTRLFATGNLSTQPYLSRWLLVTGIVFAISALSYAVRLRKNRSRSG